MGILTSLGCPAVDGLFPKSQELSGHLSQQVNTHMAGQRWDEPTERPSGHGKFYLEDGLFLATESFEQETVVGKALYLNSEDPG